MKRDVPFATEYTPPLRIAVVAGALSGQGGGASFSVASHARALLASGIEVTLFAGYSRKYPYTPELFGIDQVPIVVSRLIGPSVLGLAIGALRSLSRRVTEFDVIHLNGHWNLTTFLGACAARRRGVPYVITARGHLGRYDFRHLWALKRILWPMIERGNVRHAAIMHVSSEWERTDSALALRRARHVLTLPDAVSLAPSSPPESRAEDRQRLGLPATAVVAIFLGRIVPDKNPELLIRAWAMADRGERALLVFAGPADDSYRRRLERLARASGVGGSVRFVGYVERERKSAWFNAADFFLLPSQDDSFSVAVVEAAAAGLPCILSPYVGASEFLPREQMDLRELTPEDWSDAFTQNIRSPRRFSGAGIAERFSLETLGAEWARVYRSIVATQRKTYSK